MSRDKDFAIDLGEYLALASERFLAVINKIPASTMLFGDEIRDRWRELEGAIYEFRKRAARAKVAEAEPHG